jgi:hypothetical protein
MSEKELWNKQKPLDKLSKFYCHLLQFTVSTIDGPADVEIPFHPTPEKAHPQALQ